MRLILCHRVFWKYKQRKINTQADDRQSRSDADHPVSHFVNHPPSFFGHPSLAKVGSFRDFIQRAGTQP